MTREEALKEIDERYRFWQKHYAPECEKYGEALGLAIEALEKQIPKKPYLRGDGYADGHLVYDMWNCPNCEKTYEVDYDEYDHCPACGQAIDWSKEE